MKQKLFEAVLKVFKEIMSGGNLNRKHIFVVEMHRSADGGLEFESLSPCRLPTRE